MTTADSAHPNGSVPDAPVVIVSILGDVVTVDGAVVAHDGTRPLHHVAVHAAAERVARPLGRPVRAVATDADGRATMLVHPDGRATDVEMIESFAAADPAVEAAPVQTAPIVALPAGQSPAGHSVLDGSPLPSVGRPPVEMLPAQAAIRSATSTRVAGSARPAGWTSWVVRAVAVAAALAAVVGTGVLLLTQGREDGSPTATEPTPVAASGTVGEPTPAAGSATPPPLPVEPAGPTLTVTPVAGTGALRLTLDLASTAGSAVASSAPATGSPLVAKVSVLAADATKPLRRTVTLEESSTEVTLGKGRLPGGTATWQVRVEGLPEQVGSVTILGPYVAPKPTPTPVPVAPAPVAPAPVAPAPVAPVAPAAPPAPVTAPPPVAAPKPPPPPRATRKPEPKPDPRPPRQSKSKLKQ